MVAIWKNRIKLISKKAIMTTRIKNRGTWVLKRETCPPNSAVAPYQKCQENSILQNQKLVRFLINL